MKEVTRFYLGRCQCGRVCSALTLTGDRLDREAEGHRAYVRQLDAKHADIDRCAAPRFTFREVTEEEYDAAVALLLQMPNVGMGLFAQDAKPEDVQ